MSIIGRSVKAAHILGILLISLVFLYNLTVRSEPTGEKDNNNTPKNRDTGALTVVQTTEDDDSEEDGIITVDENGVDDTDESVEDFKPTDEWQTVKKGQKIPAGLHVRMDMETGKQEAKLMPEGSSKKMERWDAGEKIGIINTEKKRFTRDELKAALKDFKYKDEMPASKSHEEEVKKKFRSYEELKKDLQDMNMAVKTEGEIVTELEAKLRQPDITYDHLKTLLVDLEYYLHQVDNAQIFSDLGGMKTMMLLLNNTNWEIREATLHSLGAALQSNAKVQVAALDTGVMQQVLRLLSVDPQYAVRKKALFALSTLVRQFPFAQKKFLQLGGLSALADLFISSKDEKLKIKIITLLTDLLQEYDFNVQMSTSGNEVQAERTRQYKEIELRESMSVSGWCGLMTSLLHSPSGHDSVEKVVFAMSALVNTCKEEFTPARPKLQALMSEYQELAKKEDEDDSDDFFASIYSTLQVLVSKIHREDL